MSNLFITILIIFSLNFLQLVSSIENIEAATITNVTTNNWAVLVSGSNGYDNYAHQANLCHSYHVLLEKGFNPDQIIVFSYGDVADSPKNPFKGKLFNWPTGNKTGYDVNAGCKIDYKTTNVNTENFLNVMKGNATAMKGKGTGKVLKSTEKDKVFVYMNDHGGPGCFCFIDNCDLYTDDLQNALQYMFQKKMYSELVEACYSGSLFQGLPTDINVFATTAADPYQSAFFWYCGNTAYGSDVVEGKHIGSCLSGQYSTAWMHNSDTTNINNESVMKQYEIVKNKTTLSEATQYGTTSFGNNSLALFLGKKNGQLPALQQVITYLLSKQNLSGVSGQDLKLVYLQNMYNLNKTDENKVALDDYITERQNQTQFFENMARTFNASEVFSEQGYPTINNFNCYKNLNNLFDQYCGKFNSFTLQFRKIFVYMCESTEKLSYINDNIVLEIKFKNMCPQDFTLFQPKVLI